MKASEAIVILEALDPSTEVTLVIARTYKPIKYSPAPKFTMPMVDTTWPSYPQYTITCNNEH